VNRRILSVIAAVLLGGVGTFVMVAYVRGAADRAAAGEESVKVLLVDEPIEAGTPAGELDGKVALERVPAKARAEGSVKSLRELGNRVTVTNLVVGEQLVEDRFVKPSTVRAGSKSALPDGFVEVSLSLDPERAAGGLVQLGGTVSVVGALDESTPIQLLVREIVVTDLRFENELGSSGGGDDEAADADPAPSGKFLVTLGVDPVSAEQIVQAAAQGTVWLVADPKEL
jgi:pilus assembly protein CpaB